MKKTTLVIVTFFSLVSGMTLRGLAQTTLSIIAPAEPDLVPGVLYIQLKAKHGIDFEHLSPTHTGNAELNQFFVGLGVTDIYPFDADAKKYPVAIRHGIDRMYVINFPNEGNSPRDVADKILAVGSIEKACPRIISRKCYIPNDPNISQQYALDSMHIKAAWEVSKGNGNIIIADVDEGVNYTHEDLAANIYKINGQYGYNVVGTGTSRKFIPNFDPMPLDNFNHGTMTSGCFGAVTNNNKGGAGSGFNCKILAIKASDSSGNLLGGLEGIQYAVEHGAKIINCSWGARLSLKNASDKNYFDFSQQIIDEVLDSGALVIAAAGNDGLNLDDSTFSPACLNGVLTVGATAQNNLPAGFTNYGHRVNVYAPGVSIFSTSFPGTDAYFSEDGTSFSCPLTSGVAGLLWALHPDWLPQFIARQIIQTSDNVVKPSNRTKYWGRVNAYSALTQSTVAGLVISDFSVDGVSKGGLLYTDKTYSLNVKFKNLMSTGSGIHAQLLQVDGTALEEGGYMVVQGSANLGQMNSQQEATGSFTFQRDPGTDLGAGSTVGLYFAISYGSTSTVQGKAYYDTLRLEINIDGDGHYTVKGVEEGTPSLTKLENIYPNPVFSNAVINYEIGKTEFAKISICDILGRTLSILSEGVLNEGEHQVHFDTRNFEDGVYFARLETAEGIYISRIVVVH